MKAQLLVNLKIGRGVIVTRGAVYSDIDGELPEFVKQNIDNPKIFSILDATPVEQPQDETPGDKEDETPEVPPAEEPPAEEPPAEEPPAEEAPSKEKKALSRRK